MSLKRKAKAQWQGSGQEGSGTLSSTSGVLSKTPYSFMTRFKDESGQSGTNPEELIAAAHAGCFTMALSFQLSGAGFVPDDLQTEAVIEMEQQAGGFAIVKINLHLTAKVPGITEAKFHELAGNAKAGCPVSKALAAVPIELSAKLL